MIGLDGKRYGEYDFSVKGGQIQAQGLQLPAAASTLQQIEDASNTFYLKRKAR